MTIKQLHNIIDIMTDNMMNSVSDLSEKENCIKEFRTWLSLSYAGGMIDFPDYDKIKDYGINSIEKHFKEW